MKTFNWIAAAVVLAIAPLAAQAQGPTAPAAPRPSATAAVADGKVAVINSSAFGARINELRMKTEALNKKFEPRTKELEGLKNQLEALGNDIKAKQGVVAPEQLQQMVEQFESQKLTLQRKTEDAKKEYDKELNTVFAPVYKKLEDFVESYASQRNIILILDLPGSSQARVLAYWQPAIDITDDFIDQYNKANPVPGATAAPARPGGR